MTEEGGARGPFCDNCGHDLGRQGVNFCPNCGAAQTPTSEVPQGPPPGIPETDRVQTAEVPVPPPPESPSEDNGIGVGSLWRRFLGLSTAVKIIFVVVALVLIVLLSPVLGALATLAFVVSALVATVKGLRGRPARGWGIAVAVAVPLMLVSGGISNAVYGPTEEASAPESTEQERPDSEGGATEEEAAAAPAEEEPAEAEVARAEAEPTAEEEAAPPPEPAPPPKPQTPEERLRTRIEKTFMEPQKDVRALELRDSGAGCYDVYVRFNASPGFTRSVSIDGTELQMQDIYEAAYADRNLSNLVCGVTTEATGELTDNRGNVTRETVYTTSMDNATADTINWGNAVSVDFPSVWTLQYEHPALTQQRAEDAVDQAVDCADDGGFFDFDSFEC